MNSPKVAASILSADLSQLGNELSKLEEAGCDLIHLDVMDGQFVPEISFGANIAEVCAKHSKLPFEVHLMTETPEAHFERFIKAGAKRIIFHVENSPHAHRELGRLREQGVESGIALNPGTPIESCLELLESCDMVLLMTVNPGWGGQSYIQEVNRKMESLKDEISKRGLSILVEVDGGVNDKTVSAAVKSGADVLVSGSYLTGASDCKAAVESLKKG